MIRTFLLGTLILGGLAAPPALSEKTSVETLRAQEALKRLGYYTGETHGKMTIETRQAIDRYQHDKGLEMKGKLDKPTIESLGGDVQRAASLDSERDSNEHFGTAANDLATGYGGGSKRMGQGFAETGRDWGDGEIGKGFGSMGRGLGRGFADMGAGTGRAVVNTGKGIGSAFDKIQ